MLYNTQVIISASPDGTTNLDEGEIVRGPESEAGVRHVFVLVCREAFLEKSYFGFDISRFINPGGHERPGTGRTMGCLSGEIILRPRRERPRPSPLRDRQHLELPVDSLRDPFVASFLSGVGEHGEEEGFAIWPQSFETLSETLRELERSGREIYLPLLTLHIALCSVVQD